MILRYDPKAKKQIKEASIEIEESNYFSVPKNDTQTINKEKEKDPETISTSIPISQEKNCLKNEDVQLFFNEYDSVCKTNTVTGSGDIEISLKEDNFINLDVLKMINSSNFKDVNLTF